MTGLVNLWFRFPDTPALLTNRMFLAYVAVSFLVGAAISYYLDNADKKIIDILSVGLRLLGAGLVFYSLSQVWEVGIVAVIILVASQLVPRKCPPHNVSDKVLTTGATVSLLVHLRCMIPL
jgi:hypothetical protein